MIITSHSFDAYLKCPTKCWLRSRAELSAENGYADSVCAENEAYRAERLLADFPESDRVVASPSLQNLNDASWRFAIDVRLRVHGMEAQLQAIERMPSDGRGRPAQFIPYRFEIANKVSKYDKLSLAFDAFLLSEVLGRKVVLGKIVHGDRRTTLKVQMSLLAGEVRKRIKEIVVLVSGASPPDLVLNRHCSECEFQARCRRQAMEKDDLSLLSGMSEKERKKLHDKGIFTVRQLSYTFRPRRRRRESQAKQEKFHHSLRALAIRENKIHAVDLVDPKLDGTPIYLDVEGLPDRDFYYLVGLRVGTGDGAVQYAFWANDADGEKRIWNSFLDVLSAIPDPRLVHYGSYETVFLKRMRKRHGGPREGSAAATAIEHAVNLLSFVFARIYFPTFSNGLKGDCWISWCPVVGLAGIWA
jgi:predicted RecB family nuclease